MRSGRLCQGRSSGANERYGSVGGEEIFCFHGLPIDRQHCSGICIPMIVDHAQLGWVNDVERTKHAAARLEYHHSSGVQTIIAHARDLQDIRERWAVPTFMDGSEA